MASTRIERRIPNDELTAPGKDGFQSALSIRRKQTRLCLPLKLMEDVASLSGGGLEIAAP
jgi:hypothetical protein